ncbi:MAG: hypothetical protein IKG80_01660, partial [Clostridia bacterium]|nr:hypothetical protein [Clostridia bacterium]
KNSIVLVSTSGFPAESLKTDGRKPKTVSDNPCAVIILPDCDNKDSSRFSSVLYTTSEYSRKNVLMFIETTFLPLSVAAFSIEIVPYE